ncbi:unnamed protein product [Bursaphelenchus okinawaensis]|uniref:Uncharacterized protein n=1 Tax=Bursaphelenchus okinawaensis TaxID=465554 RepID=A0A811KA74_9BILA|nr:unnamed protein product [Bursaphelenchus okinawaensis]CAG9099177.1 unnamed protein product [Bursaphelenchus okinawaensis]
MIKAMKRVLENENRKDRDILNVIGTVMALSEFWFQREYQEYLDSEEKLAAAQPSEAQRQVEETREPLNDYLHSPEATLSSEKSMESRKSSTTPRQRTESEATLVQEIQNFRISSAKQQKIQNKKERAPIDTRGIKTVLSRLSNLIDGVDRLNVEFKSVEQDLHKALQELDSESCVADSPMSDTSSEQSVEESHNYENYFYL